MEITTLLRAGIRSKKGSFISVLILAFLIVATAASVMGVRKNYRSALEEAQKTAKVADISVSISDRLLTDEMLDAIRADSDVGSVDVSDSVCSGGKVIYLNSRSEQTGETDSNSYFFSKMHEGLRLYNSTFDGFEDSIPELSEGEIYLPFGLHAKHNCEVGDKISVRFIDFDKEYTIKGFLCEPMMGAMMMGWKNVFISDSDFDALKAEVKAAETDSVSKSFKLVKIYKAEGCELSDAKLARKLNLATGIISRSAGSLTKYQSQRYTGLVAEIIIDVVLGFVAVLFVIVLVIVIHSIKTEINIDYENLGILKAQGFTDRKISQTILLRYALAELIGTVFGIAASVPIERTLGGVFKNITAILPHKSIAIAETLTVIAGMLALSALVIFLSTRKLARISPVRAIAGGRKEVYFSSRFSAPISKRFLGTSIAYRAFTSSAGRYIGILLITVMLAFFTVTVNIMSSMLDSRAALESMGMTFDDIHIQFTDEEAQYHVAEFEETVEKYSRIEKKYYANNVYYSLNGENVIFEVYQFPEYIPGLLKGKLPFYDNEIMITEQVADALDLKIGDEVTCAGRKEEAGFIISGIFQSPNDAGYAACISSEGAKRLGAKYVSRLGMVLSDTSEIDKIAAELKEKYGSMINAEAVRFEDVMSTDTTVQAGNYMRIMIYAFSGIFALVAVMMVCTGVFIQERTDLGIYKAVGFTAGRLRRQFALRFMLISLVGSILGSLLGFFFSKDILNIIFSMFGICKVRPDSTPLTYISAAAFVCVCVTLFALFASRRVKKVEIRELITE